MARMRESIALYLTFAIAGLPAVRAQQPVWQPLPTAATWPPTEGQIVFDNGRRRLVAAGQSAVGESDRSVWSVRGTGIGLIDSAAAFNRARGVTVVFGGGFLFGTDGTTREWDGSAWTLPSLPLSPPPRRRASLAYDLGRQRIVLFGGQDAAFAALGDTWEYDGATWSQVASGGPSPRRDAGLAYDAARGVVVLQGGLDATWRGDTWEWNGATWTQFASGPAGVPSAFAFDEARGRLVLLVHSAPSASTATTWERNGTVWTQQQAATPFVATNGGAFDEVLDRVVAVGPATETLGFGPLWAWDGSTWQGLAPYGEPPAADGSALAACPLRASLLFYGTRTSALYGSDRTWEWRGGTWQIVPTVGQPGLLSDVALATEPAGSVLLFGGTLFGPPQNTTWRFTGSDWQLLQPANAPSPRSQHGMALDPGRQRVVLFGGIDAAGNPLGDTWEWDGGNWTQVATANAPTPRGNPAMAYDRNLGRMLLFGGGTRFTAALADLWSWDGATWQAHPATGGPTARARATMAFDPGRARMVVTGGYAFQLLGTAGQSGTWEWDGATWQTVTGTQPPGAMGFLGAFDASLGRLVALTQSPFGGGGTWQFGAPTLAAATPLPGGCAGSSGATTLGALGEAHLGNPHFALRATSLLPGAPTVFALGLAPANVALGGGCTLRTAPLLFGFAIADAAGAAHLPFPLPDTPALHGAAIYAQAAGLDVAGAFAQFAVTDGLQVTLD